MLATEFLDKHHITLTAEERMLCDEAMRVMRQSVDVHHDDTHVQRLLDYLDEFIATEEFQKLAGRVDLKVLLIACLWHDCWRSTKDPKYVVGLLWYTLYEGIGATAYFARAAKRIGLDESLASPIRYAIRKHTFLQMTPFRTAEAKLLAALDAIDHFSLDRLRRLERKYLVDRSISELTLRLAKLAIRLFVEREHQATHFFKWSEEKIADSKARFRKVVAQHLEEYETLVSKLRNRQFEEFRRYLHDMQNKYVFRPDFGAISYSA